MYQIYSCGVFVFSLLGSCTFWINGWLWSIYSRIKYTEDHVLPGPRPPIKNRLRHSISLHIIDSFVTELDIQFLHENVCYKLSMPPSLWDHEYSPKCIFLSKQNYHRSIMPLLSITFFPQICLFISWWNRSCSIFKININLEVTKLSGRHFLLAFYLSPAQPWQHAPWINPTI